MSEHQTEHAEVPFSEVFFDGQKLKRYGSIEVDFPEQPTDVTFLLVRHEADKDFTNEISGFINRSDVILLEGAGWSPEYEELTTT